jgi:hypothetical protein
MVGSQHLARGARHVAPCWAEAGVVIALGAAPEGDGRTVHIVPPRAAEHHAAG